MTEREESPAAVARAEAQKQLQHHDAGMSKYAFNELLLMLSSHSKALVTTVTSQTSTPGNSFSNVQWVWMPPSSSNAELCFRIMGLNEAAQNFCTC
jgi:hypothetical protein